MITTSSRWTNGIRDGNRRFCVVDLYYNHQPLPVLQGLEVISGSITIDQSATFRRTGSITLANSELLTSDTPLSLEPYGMELGIRWGIEYPNGDTEFVKVGLFPFDTTSWNEEGGSIPSLNLNDRSYGISTQAGMNGFEDYGGKSTIFAIGDLLSKSFFVLGGIQSTKVDPTIQSAGVVYLIVDAATKAKDVKIPGGNPWSGDFWDDITTLADSLGANIYFDVDGVNVILEQKPVLSKTQTTFDTTIDAGAHGVMISAARQLTRSGCWNAVQATGSLPANAASAQLPPQIFVYDNDPTSKTYYFGPFGHMVNQVVSSTITDRASLGVWANTILQQGLGLARSVSITMLADASLDVGDVAKVVYPSGETEMHMLQSISLDLVTATMSVTTTSQNQVA